MKLLVPVDIVPYTVAVRGRQGMDRAMAVLASAAADAVEVGLDGWQFAVEFETLAAVGLTTADLRWLALKGLVHHAVETTSPGEYERKFDHEVGPTTIGNATCITLTPLGVDVAKTLADNARRRENGEPLRSPKPVWCPDLAELRLGGQLIKRYRVPAPNQQTILSVFEEEGWPGHIDDPLPLKPERSPKRALHDTINSLNSRQVNPRIRFYGDGTGEGIRWRIRDPLDPS